MVVDSKKSLRISIAIQFDVVIREVFKNKMEIFNGIFHEGGGSRKPLRYYLNGFFFNFFFA